MDKTETLKNAGDSIRVTVRISEECRDNIKWLTRYYRTSQKDVFDKLVGFLPLFFKDNGEFLSTLISKSVEETPKSIKVRKSQVMSRRTHKMLGTVSKQFNLSRGTLIQGLSYLARMIQETSQHSTIEKHKEALKIITDFEQQVFNTEEKLKTILGDDDAVITRFGAIVYYATNLSYSISEEIEHGIPVDPENF